MASLADLFQEAPGPYLDPNHFANEAGKTGSLAPTGGKVQVQKRGDGGYALISPFGGTVIIGPGQEGKIGEILSTWAKQGSIDENSIRTAMAQAGLNYSKTADGSYTVSKAGSNPQTSTGLTIEGAGPAGSLGRTAGGGGYTSSGGGGGGGGGGRSNAGGGQSFMSDTTLQGTRGSDIQIGGGSGVPFNPNTPLGVDPKKFPGAVVGGNPIFRSGTFPSAGDPFEGIDKNSTAADVAMAIARKQQANQQASLGIYGGLYDLYGSDPSLQGARGLAGQLAANPFSLDDATKSKIAGRGIDAIGERAGRLESAAKERAAASGALGGGDLQTRIGSIQAGAANQAGQLERNLDIEQATRRPQELASALGAVGGFGQQDAAGRNAIGMGAADRVLGQTAILGDFALTGALGQGSPIKVATPNYGGYQL